MMSLLKFISLLVSILHACFLVTHVSGHGLMTCPPPRGTLSGAQVHYTEGEVDPNAPKDIYGHFPAGELGLSPDGKGIDGEGYKSQIENSDGGKWYEFEPLRADYHWKYGVCGDTLDSGSPEYRAHLSGGKYYYDGKVTGTYNQGDILNVSVSIIAHHGGFVKLHICDLDKCPTNDISPECFKTQGACVELERADVDNACTRNTAATCSPIDRNDRSRFYLGCPTSSNLVIAQQNGEERKFSQYTKDEMQFQLPADLSCSHCVVHWYWATADRCTPPLSLDYFTGPDRPAAWNMCPMNGNVIGGLKANTPECGEDNTNRPAFPEEYVKCADVSIMGTQPEPLPSNGVVGPGPAPPLPRGDPPIVDSIVLTAKNETGIDMYNLKIFHIADLRNPDIEAIVSGTVDRVTFYVNLAVERVVENGPFFISGSDAGSGWDIIDQYYDKLILFKVVAENTATGETAERSTFAVFKTSAEGNY